MVTGAGESLSRTDKCLLLCLVRGSFCMVNGRNHTEMGRVCPLHPQSYEDTNAINPSSELNHLPRAPPPDAIGAHGLLRDALKV